MMYPQVVFFLGGSALPQTPEVAAVGWTALGLSVLMELVEFCRNEFDQQNSPSSLLGGNNGGNWVLLEGGFWVIGATSRWSLQCLEKREG